MFKQFDRQEKLLLFSLAFLQFSNIVDFMIMMPLGPQLMRIFEITPKQFGMLISSYAFAAAISGFCAAFYVDRFDRKRVLMGFYLGFGLSTVGCAISTSYPLLLMARFLAGIFGGVLSALVLSIVSDAIDLKRRGAAMGVTMAAFSLASIFGVPFSLYLATRFEWHAPFWFLGIISIVLLSVISKTVPAMRKHLEHVHTESPLKRVYRMLQSQSVRASLLFMMLLTFGHFSVIPFLSTSLVANGGMAEGQLPFIYLVGGSISFFSQPWIGYLADRLGKRIVFRYSMLLSLVPIFIVTHLGPSPLFVMLSVVAIFFFCMGGRMIPAMAMTSSTVHPEHRGSYMSLQSSFQQLSSGSAAYIAGAMTTTDITGRLIGYTNVGYFAIVLSLLALLASSRIRSVEGAL